jgi:predicted transcriptional regulator
MALKDNSKIIFNYVREHAGEDFTAADIAEATNIPVKSVNGCITAMARHHEILVREEVAVTGGKVKYIRLTEKGETFDPDATEEK